MKKYLALIIVLACLSLATPAQSKIRDSIRMSAIGAPWWVEIDGQGFDIKDVRTKADGSYFLLFPTAEGLNVSLYIEPAAKCKTSAGCRDFVLSTGNPMWGKYEKLNKDTFGKFSYFEFYRPSVMDQPLRMQDMYAQYVDQGYWVDVHISKVDYQSEDKARFERLLNSIRFISKKEKRDSTDLSENIVSTGKNWLKIWDQKKCRESYTELTSISRKAVEEVRWVNYCDSVHNGLGKLKSRELIAVTTTKSLPQQPDRAGAVLRYQSTFENGSFIEFVSLTSEKDGSWTVSNYVPQ